MATEISVGSLPFVGSGDTSVAPYPDSGYLNVNTPAGLITPLAMGLQTLYFVNGAVSYKTSPAYIPFASMTPGEIGWTMWSAPMTGGASVPVLVIGSSDGYPCILWGSYYTAAQGFTGSVNLPMLWPAIGTSSNPSLMAGEIIGASSGFVVVGNSNYYAGYYNWNPIWND